MATGTPKDDPQTALFDRVINDAELEEKIETYMQLFDGVKEFNKAKKALYELLNGLELKHGDRVRIGRFVVPAVERNGGGFGVPAWQKVGIGKITALD